LLRSSCPRVLFTVVFVFATCAAAIPQTQQSSSTNAAPAVGQNQTGAVNNGESIPTIRANTRMVVVDIIARDKKGNLITDLQASDFKLLEDGKEQKISHFSFQKPAAEEQLELASNSPAPAPNVFRNLPRYRNNSALNVILLDGLNSSLLEQAYVRSEMVKFLEKLPEGHPVAIFLLGRKLRLLQDFTTNIADLKKVIHVFKSESPKALAGAGSAPQTPITLQGIAAQDAAELAPQFMSQIESFAQEQSSNQLDERVGETLAALSSLTRMLSAYSGRKNLIWISDGIPFSVVPGVEMDTSVQEGGTSRAGISSTVSRRSFSNELGLLCNLMVDAQIAVYPIDARGLVGSAFANVANNVTGQGAMGGVRDAGGRPAGPGTFSGA
jgi:VWFA-related protein